MSKKVISTNDAPAAIGPYVQATLVNGFLFTSGQIAIVPTTNTIVDGDIRVQTRQVCTNLINVLKASGMDASNVVKTTCFIKDMNDFVAFNEVYAEFFGQNAPARSCVEVARLPKDVLCEVELVAYKD
jgi:2-iminobutanoate/2-iminopropanoate deaminase